MHPFFEPLSQRDAMLLLTTLTIGGREETSLFQMLPEASRHELEQKANALLSLDSDRRVSFMVNQIKEALASTGGRGLDAIDPSWLAHELASESPRIVAAILVTLPAKTIKSIAKRLPPTLREKLPRKKEVESISPTILRAMRQQFESRFAIMPTVPALKSFSFRDIIRLERKELSILMRTIGLVELGQAFVSVGKMALIDFCRKLPKEEANELIEAVKRSHTMDEAERKSAQRFLSRVVGTFDDQEEFFHKAGLWRLAKSSLLEDPSFQLALSQRLPRDPGMIYRRLIDTAKDMDDLTEGLITRFQDSILLEIPSLVERGKLNPKWTQVPMNLHDPERATSAQGPESNSEVASDT